MTDKQKQKRQRLNMQQAAQARADISALLSNVPGTEFTAKHIADTLGISPHSAGHILAGMARGKLIDGPSKHNGKTWWSWPTGGDADPQALPPMPPAPTPPKKSTAPTIAKTTNDEVELCVAGKVIVIGTNPATGRIRITLET